MGRTLELAENFLDSCLINGLAHSFDVRTEQWLKPYPEVTGYLLSYFSEYHKVIPDKIINAGSKLASIQHRKGGFYTFTQSFEVKGVDVSRIVNFLMQPKRGVTLFTFDTAQILHGFVKLYQRTGKELFIECAERCADFLLSVQLSNGAMFPCFDTKLQAMVTKKSSWGTQLSYIQVKNIEAFLLLYSVTRDKRLRLAAEKLCLWGMDHVDTTYTHPGAYCLEGLLAAGEESFVRTQLQEKVIHRMAPNGYISYAPDLPYAYVSGTIQMGILMYKVGLTEEARTVLQYARAVQSKHSSGGLFQFARGDGELDDTVHTQINSWGVKFFCELERLVACD